MIISHAMPFPSRIHVHKGAILMSPWQATCPAGMHVARLSLAPANSRWENSRLFWRQSASSQPWKLILVSHTHWDREWYQPFQLFRANLVRAVDTLLDLITENPDFEYFTLDGQTILLEDYLEVRPDREGILRKLITEGRILVGPWYILPDEFLVSGESLVRNLLEGRRTGEQFGQIMKVGYLPDPFGHISQMPQILRGFDIDSSVLWRGTGHRVRKNESIWRAPDGSEVLLEQTPGGYDNAALLPSDRDALAERLAHIRAELEPRATTHYLLLMNGDDHMFPQAEIPGIIAEANRRLRDAELVHGTLPMLIEGIREEAAASGVEWQRVEGEFRSSELSHLLAGVLSSRINLKQRNAICQNLLERWAEPFSTFASLQAPVRNSSDMSREQHRGEAQALLRMAWRYLLMNQPHDSISGCSVDQVHEEMEGRYDWCQQVAGRVAYEAMDALGGMTDTQSFLEGTAEQGAIAVFNSEMGPRTDYTMATVDLPGGAEDMVLLGPDGRAVHFEILAEHRSEVASATLSRNEIQGYLRLSGPGRSWPHWKLRVLDKIVRAALRGRIPALVVTSMDVIPGDDPTTVEVQVEARSGQEHDLDALSLGMRQLSNLVDRGDAQFFRVRVHRRDQVDIGFVAPDVPGHGMKLFRFEKAHHARRHLPHPHDEVTLENEFFSLQVSSSDGALRLVDRETGAILWGINCFVDSGDAGDEYTYSPPPSDRIVEGPDSRPRIVIEEENAVRQVVRIEFEMRLPVGLTEDRQARSSETALCPVATWVSVYPGVPRVDVRTSVTNLARDHRLRVHFPTHLNNDLVHAEGQFDVVQRVVETDAADENWLERPVASSPQITFVDVSDGESGLMIANRGLPEYEVVKGERGLEVSLTLLRCVGWLSRDDLSARQGAAGPSIATPGAQMQGTHTFEYSVIPHPGNWENALQHAHWFARPLQARWTGKHPGKFLPETSFVTVSPSQLVLSAAKLAEDGEGDVIVRLFNPLARPVDGTLGTCFPIAKAGLVSLAEQGWDPLQVAADGSVALEIGGHKIVTVRLTPGPR